MAKACSVCGKGTSTGNQITFSHRKSRRTWKPNLRRVKALVDGSPKTINVCTRCLRSGKVERAI
ncbi:MAG: 50S ribosomal protein L28 [Andreesenia angusta]|nr:50S ribosomal protein L28 [Andreesenia angusta]